MNRLRKILTSPFYKNFLYLLSGNTVSQLIPFILAPIVARMYTTEEFALQTNFLAIVGLISVIATGRYELAIVLPKDDKKSGALFRLSAIIVLIVFLLSFVLYFFRNNIAHVYNTDKLSEYILLIPIAILSLSGYNILYNWMVRFKQFKNISFSKISQSLFGNMAYIVFGYVIAGPSGLIYGWIVGQIISMFVLLVRTIKYKKGLLNIEKSEIKSTAKEYKDFPMINSLHAFTDYFAGQFLLFGIITREYGLVTLGLFSIGYRYLIAPIQLVAGAVSQLFYRDASEKINGHQSALSVFNQTIKISIAFALPMAIIILIFGEKIFTLYLGEQWTEAGNYARILMPALFFNFLVSPLSTTPLIFNKQKKAFIITLSGYTICLISLIISYILKLSFPLALVIYSCCLSFYYLFLLFWYRSLIKQK